VSSPNWLGLYPAWGGGVQISLLRHLKVTGSNLTETNSIHLLSEGDPILLAPMISIEVETIVKLAINKFLNKYLYTPLAVGGVKTSPPQVERLS